MTDRDRWNLRGPVQKCRLQRTWYSRACGADACEVEERGDTTVLEFRADGSLFRQRHHNPDRSESTSTYEFDDAGRLVTVHIESTYRDAVLQAYEYDAEGRLARIIARASEKGDRVVEDYGYDATGCKKKTHYVDLAVQRSDNTAWGVEGADGFYSAPGAATLTTFYNELEQPAQLLFYDQAGRLLSRVEFVYDEAEHLVEEAQTMAEEALPPELLKDVSPAQMETMRVVFGVGEPRRRIHRYDEQGRRSETSSRMGPFVADRKTVVYNDCGDPVRETYENEEREYDVDEEGRLSDNPTREIVSRSEARIKYDYDARGNWVKKVVEGRGGTDQDFSVSSIESRTLAYHDLGHE